MLDRWTVLSNHISTKRVVSRIFEFFSSTRKTTSMDTSDVLKPPTLINLQTLDRSKFKKVVDVPCLLVPIHVVEKLRPVLKPYLLKMPKLKPVIVDDREAKIFFNPMKVNKWDDIVESTRKKCNAENISKENMIFSEIELNYHNWNADEIIRAILPPEFDIVRSYSKVGHIIHLNLRDHMLEFKQIIGEILLDKIVGIRTVVNKVTKIDNTYRNFQMELICGVDDMVTKVRENGLTFEFDFSKVYWNPRLSTEHKRIIDIVKPGDVLFDVFCGVGPFAIPCAKKHCKVYANDLNPDCYKWLLHNMTLNKVKEEFVQSFNKDGSDFIKYDVKQKLIDLATDNAFKGNVHVTMNLPALGLQFLVNFENLFSISDIAKEDLTKVIPTIHVYFFVTGVNPEEQSKIDFEEKTKLSVEDLELSYHYVRNVSPKRDMVRLSWKPPIHFLLKTGDDNDYQPIAKRPR